MKKLKLNAVLLMILLAASLDATAQTVSVGSDSGIPGGSVSVPLNWDTGAVSPRTLQFDVNYDPAILTSPDTSGCPIEPYITGYLVSTCAPFDADTIRLGLLHPSTPIPSGLLGNIGFTIANNAPSGSTPLTITNVVIENDPTPIIVNGSITVLGPVYSSAPPPGALDVGTAVVNAGDPSTNVVIDNTGASGTTLTGTCSETSDPSNVFSLSGDTMFSVPEAGPNDTVTVTCSDNTIGNFSGQMTCTHNGTNGPSAVYNLSCTITAGPQPAYLSNPTTGSTLNFGTTPKGDPDPTQSIDISNSGDVGTTLSGTCSITNPSGNPFMFTSDGAFSIAQGAGTDTVEVACDTDVTGTHNGTLVCPHNGSNQPNPATYPLTCTIPPEPNIATLPVPGSTIDLGTVPQNNTDPTGNLIIDNNGDPGSTLSGNCSLTGGMGPITISTGGGAYSVPEAGPDHIVTLSCDSSDSPGMYNDTLSCTHDDPDGDPTSPVTYTVECEIGQPDPALFDSNPPAASTIDLTPVEQAVVGDTAPTSPITFFNVAQSGDADLDLDCTLTGDAAISISPAVTNVIIAPQAQSQHTFSCDTATAGNFSATLSCSYENVVVASPVEDPAGGVDPAPGSASYTVECSVREAESDVDPQTPDGTTVTQAVEPGGTATYSFTFNEVNNEGEDGSLDCSLADGTAGFSILSPDFSGGSVPVPSGGSLTVVVEGTDPGGVDTTQDTLDCTYTDSNNPGGVNVSYTLVLTIGGAARFEVQKDFTDNNPSEVLMTISCNTGIVIEQEQETAEGEFLEFVVIEFDSGELSCTVTESVPNGYSATYDATGSESAFVDDDVDNPGCHYSAVAGGDQNICRVTNTPDPVDVVITKDWVIEGMDVPDGVSTEFELTLFCDGEIVDGTNYGVLETEDPQLIEIDLCFLGEFPFGEGTQSIIPDSWCKSLDGVGPTVFEVQVIPDYPSTNCYVVEDIFDDAVEVDNGCTNITVTAGQGAACTVTNTVFFEGIPTLSQYGMAIMALLMLGIGLVGFRRYA